MLVKDLLLVNEPSCSEVAICLASLLKCVSDPRRVTLAEFMEAQTSARAAHALHAQLDQVSLRV